jgi:hypothetical protein
VESTTSTTQAASAGGAPIRWPPPGLERMQGDLARVAARAALGGGIFVLPLLFVLSRAQEFATLGPFADAWWVPIALSSIGLAFSLDALVRTMTLLRRVSQALGRGYDLTTIVNVLADRQRDTGFLLTGARHFSVMDAKEREAVGAIRVFSAIMYVAAGIWLPNALAVGVLLAARGTLSPSGLSALTLLPSLVLYLFGAVAGTVDETRVRRARRRWHQTPWAEDLGSDEALEWRDHFAPHATQPAVSAGSPRRARALGRFAMVMGVLAALISVPILTLIPTSAIGPIMATLAVPGFDTVRGRAARAEALRSYVLPVDPSITPAEAGSLLQELAYVGSDREPTPGERAPLKRIAEPWLPGSDEANPFGIDPFGWADSLMAAVAGDVSPEQRAFLADVADHPAGADFSRLAHAGAIDVESARFADPLPPNLTLATMPVAWLAALRRGAYAHIGGAAYDVVNGRPALAEAKIMEVISVGLLIGDGSPALLDDLVGYQLADQGAHALASLYSATGETAKAAELAKVRGVADRAVTRVRYVSPLGAEAWVRSLPALVTDTSVVRGLRWEYFVGVTTLTPCLNLQRIVFGPDQDYMTFLESAHESLVEWPSEESLFHLAEGGWFETVAEPRTSWIGRVLGISMHGGKGSCEDAISKFPGRSETR